MKVSADLAANKNTAAFGPIRNDRLVKGCWSFCADTVMSCLKAKPLRMSAEQPVTFLCGISSNNEGMIMYVEDPAKGVTVICQQASGHKEVPDKRTGLMQTEALTQNLTLLRCKVRSIVSCCCSHHVESLHSPLEITNTSSYVPSSDPNWYIFIHFITFGDNPVSFSARHKHPDWL